MKLNLERQAYDSRLCRLESTHLKSKRELNEKQALQIQVKESDLAIETLKK